MKKVKTYIKLQVPAGKATPAPPVGSALGPHGVSAPQFAQQFNDATKQYEAGITIPVVVTVYEESLIFFYYKSPPAAVLIRKALGLEKGSSEPNKDKVGSITQQQLESIAKIKMQDLNTNTMEAAVRVIAGTARSMGVTVDNNTA